MKEGSDRKNKKQYTQEKNDVKSALKTLMLESNGMYKGSTVLEPKMWQ